MYLLVRHYHLCCLAAFAVTCDVRVTVVWTLLGDLVVTFAHAGNVVFATTRVVSVTVRMFSVDTVFVTAWDFG